MNKFVVLVALKDARYCDGCPCLCGTCGYYNGDYACNVFHCLLDADEEKERPLRCQKCLNAQQPYDEIAMEGIATDVPRVAVDDVLAILNAELQCWERLHVAYAPHKRVAIGAIKRLIDVFEHKKGDEKK